MYSNSECNVRITSPCKLNTVYMYMYYIYHSNNEHKVKSTNFCKMITGITAIMNAMSESLLLVKLQ